MNKNKYGEFEDTLLEWRKCYIGKKVVEFSEQKKTNQRKHRTNGKLLRFPDVLFVVG